MLNEGSIEIKNASIKGVVGCLPRNIIKNDYFEQYFKSEDIKNITNSTGVIERRWVSNKDSYSYKLCLLAAKDLLKGLDWEPSSVQSIIFVTQTHQNIMPAESCIIQSELGLSDSTFLLDINSGCAGYSYGCMIANTLINAGFNRVLVLAGETPSKIIDPYNKATSILFGDAGSATAIEKVHNKNNNLFIYGGDGEGSNLLTCPNNGYLEMQGAEVFTFTLKTVPKLVSQIDKLHHKPHDYYLFHQANKFILKNIIRKAKIPKDKCPINIDLFGNVSSASIPLLMVSNLKEKLINEDKNIACIGFGVGLSWSGMSFNSAQIEYINMLEKDI